MRPSLRKSLQDSPATHQAHYPAGSIVICHSCARPIYVLDRPLGLGQKAGRGASAFKPIALSHLAELADRQDIDAGLRAVVASWTLDQRKAHLAQLNEPRSGDPMICPVCHDVFVQVLTVEQNETLDRAYVIELMTIPPLGQKAIALRGRRDVFAH